MIIFVRSLTRLLGALAPSVVRGSDLGRTDCFRAVPLLSRGGEPVSAADTISGVLIPVKNGITCEIESTN